MKDTVTIAFNGGAYGTYLEWCLTALTTTDPITDPFTSNGNSHNFVGHHMDMQRWREYADSNDVWSVCRIHPKSAKFLDLVGNMQEIVAHSQHTVLLYPDQDSQVLCVNNYYQKVMQDFWSDQFSTGHIDRSKIYDNWPMLKNTPVEDIPIWVRREFLSYYLMPSWYSQIEWFFPDRWQHARCQVVFVKDLLHDFTNTLEKIIAAGKIKTLRPLDELRSSHQRMLSLQQNIGQDQLCHEIVDSTLSNKLFDWSACSLPLASQSWIQWQLRNQGWEIKCHELNTFPTNSESLEKLLIKINP
jgi:hypothetical protein